MAGIQPEIIPIVINVKPNTKNYDNCVDNNVFSNINSKSKMNLEGQCITVQAADELFDPATSTNGGSAGVVFYCEHQGCIKILLGRQKFGKEAGRWCFMHGKTELKTKKNLASAKNESEQQKQQAKESMRSGWGTLSNAKPQEKLQTQSPTQTRTHTQAQTKTRTRTHTQTSTQKPQVEKETHLETACREAEQETAKVFHLTPEVLKTYPYSVKTFYSDVYPSVPIYMTDYLVEVDYVDPARFRENLELMTDSHCQEMDDWAWVPLYLIRNSLSKLGPKPTENGGKMDYHVDNADTIRFLYEALHTNEDNSEGNEEDKNNNHCNNNDNKNNNKNACSDDNYSSFSNDRNLRETYCDESDCSNTSTTSSNNTTTGYYSSTTAASLSPGSVRSDSICSIHKKQHQMERTIVLRKLVLYILYEFELRGLFDLIDGLRDMKMKQTGGKSAVPSPSPSSPSSSSPSPPPSPSSYIVL